MDIVDFGVILVGEGCGVFGVKYIGLISGGVATLTFLGLPCFAPDSMNCLNYFSTDTLFNAESSKMLVVVANNSSPSSDSYERMSLCLPFPCS